MLHWNTHHGGVGSDGVWDPDRLMTWVAKFNPDIVSLNEVERKTSWSKNTDEPATLARADEEEDREDLVLQVRDAVGQRQRHRLHDPVALPDRRQRAAAAERRPLGGQRRDRRQRPHRSTSPRRTCIRTRRRTERPRSASSPRGRRGLAEQRIIAGDFNAHLHVERERADEADLLRLVGGGAGRRYRHHLRGQPAGDTRNSRIDFIYYSHGAKNLVLKSSQVYDTRDSKGVMPSDHRPMMSIFTVK